MRESVLKFWIRVIVSCAILVKISPQNVRQSTEPKERKKAVIISVKHESLANTRMFLHSLRQSPFPDGAHNGVIICPTEDVRDRDFDEIIAWSRTWTTLEIWSCAGLLVWLNTTAAVLNNYGSALWIDSSVRRDAREIQRAFTMIETHGGFLVEAANERQSTRCPCFADVPAQEPTVPFITTVVGLHESLSSDLRSWQEFMIDQAPSLANCRTECLSDLVLNDIAERFGIETHPDNSALPQQTAHPGLVAPRVSANPADDILVLLTDNTFFPRALVLAHQIQAVRLASATPVDLAVLLWHDVSHAGRELLRARLPGVVLQDCSNPHRFKQTVHYCKFDLFTSSTFRGRRSVLYLDADQFLLDGAALLALLFQPSRENVHMCGVGAPLHEEFEFADDAAMLAAFGHDERLLAMKVHNTRMVRFDPRFLPDRAEMETRVETAVQRWSHFSLYYEQGTLNALFVGHQAALNDSLVRQALFHTFNQYDPRPEVAFAAMFKAAAGPGPEAAGIGCSFFQGRKAREVVNCPGP